MTVVKHDIVFRLLQYPTISKFWKHFHKK